jgi:hypothetical protein
MLGSAPRQVHPAWRSSPRWNWAVKPFLQELRMCAMGEEIDSPPTSDIAKVLWLCPNWLAQPADVLIEHLSRRICVCRRMTSEGPAEAVAWCANADGVFAILNGTYAILRSPQSGLGQARWATQAGARRAAAGARRRAAASPPGLLARAAARRSGTRRGGATARLAAEVRQEVWGLSRSEANSMR